MIILSVYLKKIQILNRDVKKNHLFIIWIIKYFYHQVNIEYHLLCKFQKYNTCEDGLRQS